MATARRAAASTGDASGKSLYEQVTDGLIDEMERGTAPWQKPWAGDEAPWWPRNAVTGRSYEGINFVLLAGAGLGDPRWCTARQAASRRWRIRKGARPRRILFFRPFMLRRDGSGALVAMPTPGVLLREYEVFHASDVEGMPPPKPPERPADWSPIANAQRVLDGSRADIRHGGGRAYYAPEPDYIALPPQDRFRTPADYYATALHELAHWTGHPSRLDRRFGRRGDPPYAREELRAEIASAMLACALGVPFDPANHASYLVSWLEVLRRDRREIFSAARDAQRIADWLRGCEGRGGTGAAGTRAGGTLQGRRVRRQRQEGRGARF